MGFGAFWRQGNIDAEGLWRYFGVTNRGGFTFHNTKVQILVELGWVGLSLAALLAAVGVIALVVRFVKRPSLPMCVWAGILLYELVRTPVEAIGIAPFYFSTVLIFAAIGVAFVRDPVRITAARPLRAVGRGARPVLVVAQPPAARGRRAAYAPRTSPHRLFGPEGGAKA